MTVLGAAVSSSLVLLPSESRAAGTEGVEKTVSKLFFPKDRFTTDPAGGAIDKSVLESPSGKAAVKTLLKYQSEIDSLYAEFKGNPQLELNPRVGKTFPISELRDALNQFGEAFDENSQKETDKVVRNIIQDIGELQTAGALRAGTVRTERKIQRTNDWFERLTTDFKRLMSFYS